MDMWKKSEILNNKKFRILLLLEALLLLVPVMRNFGAATRPSVLCQMRR